VSVRPGSPWAPCPYQCEGQAWQLPPRLLIGSLQECKLFQLRMWASSVWFERCKGRYKSLHFRLLRTACKDYGLNRSKAELTKTCKRATPEEWAKFATASKVTKNMRDEQPKPLFTLLQRTLFGEQRRCGFGKFFDGSKDIRPCKTDWRAWRKSLNLGWIRNWMTTQSEFWWRNHFLTIWKSDHF